MMIPSVTTQRYDQCSQVVLLARTYIWEVKGAGKMALQPATNLSKRLMSANLWLY